jgi:RNA polymerase sigma-70 factor (ECF subfamily)
MPSARSLPSLSLVVGKNRANSSVDQLVRGLVDGEPWAIGEVWHRFAPMVLTMAERCLGSSSEADDICQEVFCRVIRRAGTLRDPECLRSFIYSFAVRAVKTVLRRRKLRAWLSFEDPGNLTDLSWETADVESRDVLRRFHKLLERLTPRDRLIFILRRMESMTVEEIAEHMQLSESTVKRSVIHATERLESWLGADPDLTQIVKELRGEQ